MECLHCGAPGYGIGGRGCRYCGTELEPHTQPAEAEAAQAGEEATAVAMPELPWHERPSFPVAFGGSAALVWRWLVAGETGWRRSLAIAEAVPIVAAAWIAVAAWLLVARVLEELYYEAKWKEAGWLLVTGVERPWVGFLVGGLVAIMLAALGVDITVRLAG